MALNGLKSFMYSKLSVTDDAKYQTEATKLAGAIECSVDITLNDAKLYADDDLQDEDTSFNMATIKITVDKDDISIIQPLLGSEVTEASIGTGSADNVIVAHSNADDIPAFVGFGYITKAADKYRVKFYPKVRFKPYDTSPKTKQDKTEFITPQLEGTVYKVTNGDWRIMGDVDTLDNAILYLKSLFVTE